MNRYPLWKYLTVLIAVVIGLLYTLPNLYGESPAVQISSAKATLKIDAAMLDRVQGILLLGPSASDLRIQILRFKLAT